MGVCRVGDPHLRAQRPLAGGRVGEGRSSAPLLDERRLVLIGLACALAYTTLTLTVSVLIQRAIDGAIVPGSSGALWPYVVAIMALGLARFWVNYTRRFATSRVGIRLEARLREMLYAGYLRFPRAFYDQ